jgi:hypothetical protein
MQQHHTGEQLPNGATVTSVVFAQHPDGTTVEDVRDSFGNRSVQAIAAEGSPASNQAKLKARAIAALTNNATYLSGGVADHEQVQALTRQVDTLIRIVLALSDTTVGT